MRICYVTHTDSHFSSPYVDYFAARGHDVHVVTAHHWDMPPATVHHLLNRPFDPHKANLIYFWLAVKVRAAIRRIRPDIVHAHYVTSNGFMAAASGFHPLVVSARGSDVLGSMRHPLKRRLIVYTLKRADLVNPVSRELEQAILDLGVPESRVLRLTQGIDTVRFACRPTTKGTRPQRIICTRKLFPLYEPHLILDAAERLHAVGLTFELLFAATGPMETEMRARTAASQLDGVVRFRGGFTAEELPGLLAESDVYVSASKWDGTSPALLEAMAAGLVPVVSDIPANREWLDDDDALWFPPGDADRLLAGLRRALAEPHLRQESARVLPQKVAARGDRSRNLSLLEEWYHRLADNRRARTDRAAPN